MRWWRLANLLSLDVAMGSVAGCAFFGSLFGVHLLPHAYVSLGLIVWMVYTVDHLADASRSVCEPSTERHRFHKRYQKHLTALVIIAGIIVAMEAFYVRKPVLFAGIGVALLVMGYLAWQANLKSVKELAGALLYTAGIVAAPWSLLNRELMLPEMGLVTLYGLTALNNLMLFSLFDRESDLKDDRVSIATIVGDRATRGLIIAGLAGAGGLGFLLITQFPGYAVPTLTVIAMNLALYCILHFQSHLRVNDHYRRLGDLAFLVPGVYLIYQHALEWI
jgi:hypothetical protein